VKTNHIIIKAKICENRPYRNKKVKYVKTDHMIIKGKVCENRPYNNKR
jgi:hypothetical protein